MKKKIKETSIQKLLGDYADKIVIYMKENKSLKRQLDDLKITLSINKDMLNNQIKNLTNNTAANNQMSEIIKSLQDENIQISNRNMKLYQDNLNLEKKLYKCQNELNDKIRYYEEEIRDMSDKIFIYSNQIMSKDNEIKQFKIELLNSYKDDFLKEIYVYTTPSKFTMEMNNELCEARQVIVKYSHLLNDANKLINELNIKIVSLKEMIQNIKNGKRVMRNLENIENFGYILTEDSNDNSNDEEKKNLSNSFYNDENNGNIVKDIDIDEDQSYCCDSPLVQLPDKIKQKYYLTTTGKNSSFDIQIPKLDLSTIINKYKPIEKKEEGDKKENNHTVNNNNGDDKEYIDKLKFKLKFYRNMIKAYKVKFKQQKQIISMLKKHCLRNNQMINTPNCSTSDSKLKNYPNSNETRSNKTNNNFNFTLKNGYSMENNVNFSMESDTDENELNIVINEVNKEGIEMLSESNSFYNSNNK
jgi:hypothetical protein